MAAMLSFSVTSIDSTPPYTKYNLISSYTDAVYVKTMTHFCASHFIISKL